MDEQQPAPDEPFDDEVYVRAWWQRSEYFHGTQRSDEAGYALDWAHAGVMNHVRFADSESAVTLMYRLLDAPGADPRIVAEGPLQELLEDRGPEVQEDIADLCTRQPMWRQAVAAVELTPAQRAAVPALEAYLS